uniref:Uncharacterized protein n=1 Tax=Rhodopseudomonas palustris (strain BisA53) TaxID=316055 RepID=Q07KQ8_RHOP5
MSRPSTSLMLKGCQDVDARDERGHDESNIEASVVSCLVRGSYNSNMVMMTRSMILLLIVVMASAAPAGEARAQFLPPGSSALSPPPPAPPPPPKIEVPAVPQLDAAPSRPTAPIAKKSFGDRVIQCLDDAAAAGMKPNQRAAYSRACANR